MKDVFSKIVNDYRPYTFLQIFFLLMFFSENGYRLSTSKYFYKHYHHRCSAGSKVRVCSISISYRFHSINHHWVKSLCIRYFSGPPFSPYELNTEIYSATLRIQFKYRKIRTRKIPNTDTFCPVYSPM